MLLGFLEAIMICFFDLVSCNHKWRNLPRVLLPLVTVVRTDFLLLSEHHKWRHIYYVVYKISRFQ